MSKQSQRHRTPAYALIVIVILACTDRAVSPGDVAEVRGDTTVIWSRAPAVWNQAKVLEEDLRITGANGVGFADPADLVVASDGTIILSDMPTRQVLRFSADGTFLGQLGRSGSGPGEFNTVNGVAVSTNGSIFVRDPKKIVVFGSNGEYKAEWSIASLLMSDRALAVTADSVIVMKVMRSVPTPFEDVDLGFVTISPSGQVHDTLGPYPTPWDDESQSLQKTHPHRHVEWGPDGPVAAVSSRLAYEVNRSDGTLRVERDAARARFLPEEREEWEAHYRWLRGRWGRQANLILPTPDLKPMFQSIGVSRTGEVWLRRHVESTGVAAHAVSMIGGLMPPPEWDEPLLLEVFAPDGEYLGSVEGPIGVNVRMLSGDTIWALQKNSYGEEHIVRYVAK